MEISGWGSNVYVKIPITNTRGRVLLHPVERLSLRDAPQLWFQERQTAGGFL